MLAERVLERPGGHRVVADALGEPGAPTVLLLHGGPGGRADAAHRRHVPAGMRVVQLDQRGCGRSAYRDLLHRNTTADLIDDIEAVRVDLGVARWFLAGGSWGALLAVLYAERHPDRVEGLVLRSPFLDRRIDRAWLVRPDAPAPRSRSRLHTHVPDLADPFGELGRVLERGDETAVAAAAAWIHYERVLSGLAADDAAPARPSTRQLLDMRLEMHYLAHGFFVEDDEASARASVLGDLPGVVVQGGADHVVAPDAADHLVARWPGGVAEHVPLAAHSLACPVMTAAWEQALRAVCAQPSTAGARR